MKHRPRSLSLAVRSLGVSTLPVLVLTLLPLLAACGSQEPSPAEGSATAPAPAPGLEVHDAQAQLMGTMGAVYFTVVNGGAEADRLVRVETPAAGAAETHESLVEEGVVRMRASPEGFEVPAGASLVLEPGGKHVMLLAVDPAVAAAGKLPVTLVFEHAAPVGLEIDLAGSGEAHAMPDPSMPDPQNPPVSDDPGEGP